MGAAHAVKALVHPPTLVRTVTSAVQSPTAHVSRTVSSLWRGWALVTAVLVLASITFFLVLEFSMLAQGRAQDTLSAQVWRILGSETVAPVSTWSAVRVLTLVMWLVMWLFVDLIAVWLTGHFWWHVWH